MNPQPLVYLNGQFVPRSRARFDVEDRAVMFADGVYEVLRYFGGRALAMDGHLARLRRSLAGIGLPEPADVARLASISDELVSRNRCPDAKVYWQISRGSATRDRALPKAARPSVLVMTWPDRSLDRTGDLPCITAILAADRRWHRCWIKSLMLLENVLALREAAEAGADEAIFERGGTVTEATSSNVFIVTGGRLRTHPADEAILAGITRAIVLDLAHRLDIPTIEQPFAAAELSAAEEVFICGTTTFVTAVTRLGDRPIGSGAAGPMTRRLHAALGRHIADACGLAAVGPNAHSETCG